MKDTVNHFERHQALGYKHIIPITAAGCPVSERSSLHRRLTAKKPRDDRGKAPGYRGADGLWFSLSGWQKDLEVEAAAWHAMGAGVGIKLGPVFDGDVQLPGHIVAIDADTYIVEHARTVKDIIDKRVGTHVPIRVGQHPKALYLLRTDADVSTKPIAFGQPDTDGKLPNRIEVLAKGAQFVSHGIHPKTLKPYEWKRPLLPAKDLPYLTADEFHALIAEIMAALPNAQPVEGLGPPNTDPVSPEHRRADAALVRKAVQALTNTTENFPSRDHYINMMYMVRGALPDDEATAFEIVEDWAYSWDDPDGNDPDIIRDDWRRMKSEPRSGFPNLLNELRRIGKNDVATELMARHMFDHAAVAAAANEAPLQAEKLPNHFEQSSAIHLTPLRQFDPKTLPKRQWLYGNHYIRKYVSATAAPSAVGKSSMTMVEALAMASGKPLLGVQPKGTFRVWIWNGEDPMEELELRIAAAMQHYGLTWADLGDRVFLDSGRAMPVVLAVAGKQGAQIAVPVVEGVIAGMQANRIDVAVMDPFVSTFSGPETNEMFEPIVKKWGFIAGATNASVELVHHTRKLNGAETGVEDMRGGGALVAGARAKRVLARMSAAEAKKFGVREDDHRRFFRVADASVNMALPAVSGTTWFEMKGVAIGNGEGEGPLADITGDQVGVATLRTFAASEETIDSDLVERIKDALRGGEWRENFRSEAWAGYAVAEVLGLDARDDRIEIEKTLKDMKAANALKVERRANKSNNIVPYIVVVDEDNSSEKVDNKSENPFE